MNIPYIRQSGAPADRMCGAACLSMVYKSLGLDVSQEEIWPAIAKRNPLGSIASTTHLMAKDAISRGFDAVVFQASKPLQALRVCRDQGIRAIVNHRMSADSPAGHYSVLTDIQKSDILLHDPLEGPKRRLSFETLLQLWAPGVPISETIGNVVICIAPRPAAGSNPEGYCACCKLVLVSEVNCPKCQQPVRVSPSAPMGCTAESCIGRQWTYLCCPECDCIWSFHGKPVESAAKEQAAKSPVDPMDVDAIYKRVEGFFNFLNGYPGTAGNEEVQKQMDFVYSQREPLRMALAEAVARQKLRREQLDAMVQTAQMNAALHQKRAEEATRQSPPLDGDALGMALLRNLGFVR